MKRLIFFILLLLSFSSISAQTPKGNLKGTVLDEQTQTPLVGANIFIKSLGIGATTNEKGSYEINNINVGTYSVTFSYIGYNKSIKTDVIIKSQKTIFLNVNLSPSTVELEAVGCPAQFG